MTTRQLFDVCWRYADVLGAHVAEKGAKCKLCHVAWMLSQMLSQDDYDVEPDSDKLNRWLGFIQGVFWCEKVFTIDEMREHNR